MALCKVSVSVTVWVPSICVYAPALGAGVAIRPASSPPGIVDHEVRLEAASGFVSASRHDVAGGHPFRSRQLIAVLVSHYKHRTSGDRSASGRSGKTLVVRVAIAIRTRGVGIVTGESAIGGEGVGIGSEARVGRLGGRGAARSVSSGAASSHGWGRGASAAPVAYVVAQCTGGSCVLDCAGAVVAGSALERGSG